MRESLVDAAKAPLRRWRNGSDDGRTEDFWALRGVDFEIQPGEVVGIIGRNGAGKSTLLKILSRITKPTTGRVELHGRVGSLLEVGTGFHPELTGRENIYLNGSILGMRKAEIARKFDQIVAFAGVEQFLDTPAKRYSSGMYVRLAFSVAAHFEPEILVVDEVLAVGDAIFQRRCIDRMTELARSGCTLLFVSHNMDLIPKLCERAILLNKGQIEQVGPADKVADAYIADQVDRYGDEDLTDRPRRGDGRARFERLSIIDEEGNPVSALHYRKDLRCMIDIRSNAAVRGVSLAIVVKSLHGARIMTSWTDEVGRPVDLVSGLQRYECRFRDVRIRPGRQVAIDLWMCDGEELDVIEHARILDVVEVQPSGYSSRSDQGYYVCDYILRLCEL
jgi:lipopolysaccharide transport system ATP-binding protein